MIWSLRVLSITIVLIAVSSCNIQEIESLRSKNRRLENENRRLENENSELRSELDLVRDELMEIQNEVSVLQDDLLETKQELEFCNWQYEGYRYGELTCVTRYWKDVGQRRVCGAENIIDMLMDGYCPYDCRFTSSFEKDFLEKYGQ